MSDTIRELIIQSIVTALADVRLSGGYNTDAGVNVLRGMRIVDKAQLPAISVLPLTEDNFPVPGRNVLTMRVRVDGIQKFRSDENASKFIEKLLGDIIKRMTNPDLSSVHGGYAETCKYVEGGVDDYPEAGQETIACYATFEVIYKYKIGDPYNQ